MTFEQFKKSICDKDPQVKWALDLVDEEVRGMIMKGQDFIRDYEYDSEAHSQGKCSHSLAVCSMIEQEVKMQLGKLLDKMTE